MNNKKREEIMNRYYSVIAEKNLQRPNSEAYIQLSKIAKLILSELQNGKHPRYIMFMRGTQYDYRCE